MANLDITTINPVSGSATASYPSNAKVLYLYVKMDAYYAFSTSVAVGALQESGDNYIRMGYDNIKVTVAINYTNRTVQLNEVTSGTTDKLSSSRLCLSYRK